MLDHFACGISGARKNALRVTLEPLCHPISASLIGLPSRRATAGPREERTGRGRARRGDDKREGNAPGRQALAKLSTSAKHISTRQAASVKQSKSQPIVPKAGARASNPVA